MFPRRRPSELPLLYLEPHQGVPLCLQRRYHPTPPCLSGLGRPGNPVGFVLRLCHEVLRLPPRVSGVSGLGGVSRWPCGASGRPVRRGGDWYHTLLDLGVVSGVEP